MPRRSVTARTSDSRVLQTRPSVRPASSQTTVGHTSPGNGVAERQPARIQRHTDLCIGTEAVEFPHFRCGGDSTRCSHPCSGCGTHDSLDRSTIEPAHFPFPLHLREEEAADGRRERSHTLEYADARLRAPTVHHDFATFGVHGRDDALARQGTAEFRGRGGADHHLDGAGVEPASRAVEIAYTTADAAGRAACEIADYRRVRPTTERGVEIHDGHVARQGELLQPGDGIAAVKHKFLAAPQLHRAPTHDVDAGDDHCRTRIPRTARSALIPSTVSSPS